MPSSDPLPKDGETLPDDEFVLTSAPVTRAEIEELNRLMPLDVREGFRLDLDDA